MLDQANYTPRLKAQFRETIRAAMKEEFGYKNDMQIPRLDKIVLNMGIGEAVENTRAGIDETAGPKQGAGAFAGAGRRGVPLCDRTRKIGLRARNDNDGVRARRGVGRLRL